MIGRILGTTLEQLNKVEKKDDEAKTPIDATLIELDLRLTLNIFLNLIIFNNDDPSFASEFLNDRFI